MRLQRHALKIHAPKFLRAFGLTSEAVDCPHTYDQLTKANIDDAVETTVREMLKVLGYSNDSIIFNYRDSQTIDAMLRLIGAQLGENLHDKERNIRRYLADNAAEYLKPGEDFDPETILNETVSEHVDKFQLLFDEIVHLPQSGAEGKKSRDMEMMAATEALVGARDLARIYHIPLSQSPHPALAILEPHVARWEAKEAAAKVNATKWPTSKSGWTEADAKRFLAALGITPHSAGAHYDEFLHDEHLEQFFKKAIFNQMDQLGHRVDELPMTSLTLRDTRLKEAMHTLFECHTRGFEALTENNVKTLIVLAVENGTEEILTTSIDLHSELFGKYLNYAPNFCNGQMGKNPEVTKRAILFSQSLPACFQAQNLIASKCKLPPTEMLHPAMEAVRDGKLKTTHIHHESSRSIH